MNKHKHDWKHFSRRTLSLILVLVTLVALCIPTGMALEDGAADEGETPAVTVQTAENEPAAEPVALTEAEAEPVSEDVTEPVSEDVTEPVSEDVTEPVGEDTTEPVSEDVIEPRIMTVMSAPVMMQLPDEENAVATQALTSIDNMAITDDIKASGVLKVTVPENVVLGTDVTYKWYKSDSRNGTYTEVTRKKVTGSSYNVTEYGDQVNVVLDDGAQKWYKVEAINADGQVIGTSDVYQVNFYKEVQNGSFENPTPNSAYQQFANGTSGLVWQTTGSDRSIEIVKRTTSGRNSTQWAVNAYYGLSGNLPDGNQFAELNAEAYGTLYQDVLTTPNATLNWQLYHSARLQSYWNDYTYYDGTDVMYVMIMSTTKAEQLNIKSTEDVKAIVDAVNSGKPTYNNIDLTGVSVNYVADGGTWNRNHTSVSRYYQKTPDGQKIATSSEWTRWTGNYTVPSDQYMTRFFFVSYASASGNETVGNMLDDVMFTTNPLPPEKDRGNLTVTKQVSGLADLPDNYSVTVSIGEGTTESYTFNANEFELVNGVWTASHSFQNIDANKNYTVTETNVTTVNGYNWTTADADKTKTVYLADGKTENVIFTNSYEQSTGTLKVVKTIVNNTKWMTDAELAAIKANLTFTATSADGEPRQFTGNWEGDTFTAEIADLPAGSTWTVSESGENLYSSYYNCVTTGNGDSATIVAGETQTVTITNTYTDLLVNLTINKTVTNNTNKNEGSFTFVATNNHTGVSYTATIVTAKNGSYTIEGIPAGEYTVTELDNDNYQHDGAKSATVTITEGTGTVSFKNKGDGDSYQYSSSVVNKSTGKLDDFKVKFEQFKSTAK